MESINRIAMHDVKILWDGDTEDSFYIEAEGNCVAEMMVGRGVDQAAGQVGHRVVHRAEDARHVT